MNDPLDLSQPAEPLHDDADVSERAPEPPPKRGAGAKLQLPPPPVITAPPAVAADDAGIAQASGVLKAGGLVAFPTETVYGLGADASNAQAVARIFAVKGRPRNHPLIVHLASADDLATWAVDVSEDARQLARAFWPGPLTLILKRAESVLDAVTGEQDTVAVRVPSHPKALALLEAFGGGIAAPSANKFGRISPTTPDHVRLDLGQEVDLVLDGGACEIGIESTIVDCSGERPRLLRPGKITATEIEALLGEPLTGNAVTEVVAGVEPRVTGSH